MREIRLSGSEGGGAETNRPSLPLFTCRGFGPLLEVTALSAVKRSRRYNSACPPFRTSNGPVTEGADSADHRLIAAS